MRLLATLLLPLAVSCGQSSVVSETRALPAPTPSPFSPPPTWRNIQAEMLQNVYRHARPITDAAQITTAWNTNLKCERTDTRGPFAPQPGANSRQSVLMLLTETAFPGQRMDYREWLKPQKFFRAYYYVIAGGSLELQLYIDPQLGLTAYAGALRYVFRASADGSLVVEGTDLLVPNANAAAVLGTRTLPVGSIYNERGEYVFEIGRCHRF